MKRKKIKITLVHVKGFPENLNQVEKGTHEISHCRQRPKLLNIIRAGSLNHFSSEPDRGKPNFSQSQRGIS